MEGRREGEIDGRKEREREVWSKGVKQQYCGSG